jgi:hypothetical protein
MQPESMTIEEIVHRVSFCHGTVTYKAPILA